MEELRSDLQQSGLTQQEISSYLVYCSGFYGNMGNYKGFGDSKFVPNMEEERMELLVKASKAYETSSDVMEKLLKSVEVPMFSLSDRERVG